MRPASFFSLRRQPSTTFGVRPSGVLIMRKLWKPADARTRLNMHPDRFRNRFGADTVGIWLRYPKFPEMRLVAASKWSQNGSRCLCVTTMFVTLYSFLNNSSQNWNIADPPGKHVGCTEQVLTRKTMKNQWFCLIFHERTLIFRGFSSLEGRVSTPTCSPGPGTSFM